jgi:hypothetical protein
MMYRIALSTSLAAALLALVPCAVLAQADSKAPAKKAGRTLAPGVMQRVDPKRQHDETYSRHDLIEILTDDPKFDDRPWNPGNSVAKDVRFEREIWALDFEFKPVRFIEVDLPQASGRMSRKLVWYLMYRVRNSGDKPVRFTPRFVLTTVDTQRSYPDRLLPLAVRAIERRERPDARLKNTVEMTGEIQPEPKGFEQGVWGVATWEDVDPRSDDFQIFVQGLTNAYQWVDQTDVYKPGDPPGTGRLLFPKTLILDFWRPGDEEDQHEEEVRFEDYRWEYGQLTPAGFIGINQGSAAFEEPAVAEPAEAEPAAG